MQDTILVSGRGTLRVAIPFVFMWLFGVFRLDSLLATPKGSLSRRRPPCGVDEHGEPILADPDGRVVSRRHPCR